MKYEIKCCEQLSEAEEMEGIFRRDSKCGADWIIAWDAAYTGYHSIAVKFCPYCGEWLPQ